MAAVEHGLPEPVAEHLEPTARYGIRTVLLIAAVSLVGIPFGYLLIQVTSNGPVTRWDHDIAGWLHDRIVDRQALIWVCDVFSFLGKPVFLFFAVGIPVVFLWRRGATKLAAFLVVTTIGGGLVDTAVKLVVGRPRPEFDNPISSARGNSFPSGHSMSSLIAYGALLVVFVPAIASPRWRRAAIGSAVALVLAIGVSRLALGVHFVSDVLGGYTLGAAWLCASIAAFEVYREERGRPKTAPLTEGIEPEETEEAVRPENAGTEPATAG
jgi:undecaprenyl-diphosphatase